jgi:hypothetical protein
MNNLIPQLRNIAGPQPDEEIRDPLIAEDSCVSYTVIRWQNRIAFEWQRIDNVFRLAQRRRVRWVEGLTEKQISQTIKGKFFDFPMEEFHKVIQLLDVSFAFF